MRLESNPGTDVTREQVSHRGCERSVESTLWNGFQGIQDHFRCWRFDEIGSVAGLQGAALIAILGRGGQDNYRKVRESWLISQPLKKLKTGYERHLQVQEDTT